MFGVAARKRRGGTGGFLLLFSLVVFTSTTDVFSLSQAANFL